MAANNFYLGLTMAQANAVNNEAIVGTASTDAGPAQGTAADIELRIQTNSGSGPKNGIKRKDVVLGIKALIAYVESGGSAHAGQYLPGL